MGQGFLLEFLGWEIGILAAVIAGILSWVGFSLKKTRSLAYETKSALEAIPELQKTALESKELLTEILSELKTHNKYSDTMLKLMQEHVTSTAKEHAEINTKLDRK